MEGVEGVELLLSVDLHVHIMLLVVDGGCVVDVIVVLCELSI